MLLSKCEWFGSQVKFLGHSISENRLRKFEKFLQKVRKFCKPTVKLRELKKI